MVAPSRNPRGWTVLVMAVAVVSAGWSAAQAEFTTTRHSGGVVHGRVRDTRGLCPYCATVCYMDAEIVWWGYQPLSVWPTMARVRTYDRDGQVHDYMVAPPGDYYPRYESYSFSAGPHRTLLLLGPPAPPAQSGERATPGEGTGPTTPATPGEPTKPGNAPPAEQPGPRIGAASPAKPADAGEAPSGGEQANRADRVNLRRESLARDNKLVGDLVFASMQREKPLYGWRLLEDGQYHDARRAFADESARYPTWGLPKAGQALALAMLTDGDRAALLMRRAFAADAQAIKTLPAMNDRSALLKALTTRYLEATADTAHHPDAPFMAAALAYFQGDKTAAESLIRHDADLLGQTSANQHLRQFIAQLPDRR
jgi:hypothetical protein